MFFFFLSAAVIVLGLGSLFLLSVPLSSQRVSSRLGEILRALLPDPFLLVIWFRLFYFQATKQNFISCWSFYDCAFAPIRPDSQLPLGYAQNVQTFKCSCL